MSILLIPHDIILEISKLLMRKKTKNILSYPMWNLYATCKSFTWLEELEYLCVENYNFNISSKIISRTITGKFQGMSFQYASVRGICYLIGYYGSDKPKEGYNYSKWHMSNPICCTTNNCKSCTQLIKIQQEICEKDYDIANIFKNYQSKNYYWEVIIRKRNPLLHFKFNY